MLNINAFFEFKQRTRHVHSFQLAQLMYHAQHLHDYYTLPPNIGTESTRRISTSSNDPVSSLFQRRRKKKKRGNELFLLLNLFIPYFMIFISCVFVCMHYLDIALEMVLRNAISNIKCKEKKSRAETSVVCFVVFVCVCACVCVFIFTYK